MEYVKRALVGAAVLAATLVTVGAQPASAAVVATTSGTVVGIAITGDADVTLGCWAGKAAYDNVQATPLLDCGSVTKWVITGDAGNQRVFAGNLAPSTFTAHPFISAVMGDGADLVIDTPWADAVNLGPGNDWFTANAAGEVNTSVNLGADSDYYDVQGGELDDTIEANSGSPSVSVSITNTTGTKAFPATNVEQLRLSGNGGDDTLDVSGIIPASAITSVTLDGGPGDDETLSLTEPVSASGGAGTNVLGGGSGNDYFSSESTTDTMYGNGGTDWVYDQCCGRSGGRRFTHDGGQVYWATDLHGGDVVARIRPDNRPGRGAGYATLAVSLHRPGFTEWAPGTTYYDVTADYVGEVDNRALGDIVIPAGGAMTDFYGDSFLNDLADVTVPSGSWVIGGTPSTVLTIDPVDDTYGVVHLGHVGAYKVHGPWVNKNQGFAHRVTRDLVFRFPSDAARDALRDQLAAGTITRGQAVHDLVYSDEYRGLDVDRVFVRFLKRTADASGRTYWINGIRSGKSLTKFRAQLFGSNEYFTKAGSTTDGFVRAAYQDVLGRLPDPSGETYWVNKINAGTGRGSVANAFLVSTEARRTIVKDQFLRFLDREPNASETSTWMATLLTSPTGEQDLVAFLAGSSSYYNRS